MSYALQLLLTVICIALALVCSVYVLALPENLRTLAATVVDLGAIALWMWGNARIDAVMIRPFVAEAAP